MKTPYYFLLYTISPDDYSITHHTERCKELEPIKQLIEKLSSEYKDSFKVELLCWVHTEYELIEKSVVVEYTIQKTPA